MVGDDEVRRGVMRAFRRAYGSNPLHLIGHLALFIVAVWAIGQILAGGAFINWIAWFVGAALLHDLVLLPLYSSLDRGVGFAGRHRPAVLRPALPFRVRNHLRAPAAIAGVLLLVYFPLILGLSSSNYKNDTGHKLEGYTRNWLLITAGLFLASAIIYAMRVLIRRSRLKATEPAGTPGEPGEAGEPGEPGEAGEPGEPGEPREPREPPDVTPAAPSEPPSSSPGEQPGA
jgi:hypothetical protein